MIKNYIKTAIRSLRKNKGFTAINVLGLSAGLATFLLILFYVVDELSYDRFNKQANRIYRVNTDIKFGGNSSSYAIAQPPLAAVLRSTFPEIEKAGRIIVASDIRFRKGNENLRADKVAYADNDIFNIFTLPMIEGNPANALTEPHTIVITERAALKFFNRTNVVGQFLTLVDSNANYIITGVIRNMPVQSHLNFDYLLSMPSLPSSRDNNWGNFSFTTYILIKQGATPKKLAAQFPALIRKNSGLDEYDEFEKEGNYIRLNLTPLTAIHLHSNRLYELGSNSNIENVYIFSAIAIFVLLIACINFMNLSTARSSSRAREVGVRKVMGSLRIHLVMQFLAESVLVTLLATLIAILVAWALLPVFNKVANKELLVTPAILAGLLPVLFTIVILVGVLAGSYPAFFLSKFQPIQVLKGKLAAGFRGAGIRSFLVVFQFSISIFLITGTLIVYNQLHFIQHKDLGFDRNHVLVVKNMNALADAKTFKREISQFPEVKSASLSSFIPTGVQRNTAAVYSNKETDSKNALLTEIWPVDEDYLNTMGMKLSKGRNFSASFGTDSSAMIINETAARMLGFARDPLNRTLYEDRDDNGNGLKEFRVIGVLKDFNFTSLRDNITPVVLKLAESKGALSIRIDAKKLAPFIEKMENKWNVLAPGEHFEYSFMDDEFNTTYRTEQRTGNLFLSFTILACLIACLGLFSLAAYAAEQRSKEIGVRKVLGATVTGITAMLTKDFIRLIIVAILIATPLAWWAGQKWLQGFAYRINIHWWVLALAGFAAVLIALITISFQSIKAALANPINSLRSE